VTIDSGDNFTLSWSVTDATTCTASGAWSGSKNANGGSEVINNVTSGSTYTLQCTGDGGTDSDSVTVNVQIINSSAGFIFTRGGNIYKIDTDGTNEVELTSAGTDSNPEVSSDGWVYFSRTRSGGKHNIWKIKTNGTQLTKITNDDGNDTEPLLGNGKLLFKSDRLTDIEYYHSDLDGGNITGFDPKNNFYLANISIGFHSGFENTVTSSTVAWVNYNYIDLFDYNYISNTKGTTYNNTAGANHYIWSSDGNTLIMGCIADSGCGLAGNLYAYNRNTGDKSLITTGDYPSMLSSGNKIVYVNSSGHIATINIDGTDAVDLNITGSSPKYSAL
jgi:hypothetical protein